MDQSTWSDVIARIAEDDRGKWDRKLPASALGIAGSGRLSARNGGVTPDLLTLSDLATTQLCQRLEVPVGYYRRLPAEMKATVANFDLDRLREKSFLLRGRDTHVRAVLSGEYVAYDNRQIGETVAELLSSNEIRIKSFVLDEERCYLKLIAEELAEPVTGLKAGIMIGNSEVGVGSISVEPFVYRKACTNDLVVTDEKAFRHAHIHLTASELTRRMAEAIGETFVVASQVLDRFLEARHERIEDPLAVIRRIADDRKMTQKLTDEVVARYVSEPEPNRFGVINAFTAAAQTLAPIQRIELERFAGHLLSANIN